jgi:3',5'-cyclic AMP phosphodiesterase CpdA
MAMSRLAGANADLFLSGHLHITHVSRAADRYEIDSHSGLIVQAGTVSTRGRGELPSFNVLRMQRPEIVVERRLWDEATKSFTAETVGCYQHSATGWAMACASEARP